MRLPTGRAPARPAAVLPSLALAMVLASGGLAGCGEHARLPFMAGVGPDPVLPPPVRTAIPTVDIAPAVGWPPGASPTPAAGLSVTPLATGLDHPRWLHVLPNGDVLVAETNAPPRERRDRGLEARVMGLLMARAGAGTPSADRITLLRDADGDGRAELRSVFLDGLASPFGMALVGDTLYIANTDALVRVPYRTGQLRAEAAPELVVSLPAGPRNHHWTKNVIAAPDGARLYVTVGSNSNVAEHGMEEEVDRAAILEVDPVAGTRTPFATGLRNPNGMAWRGGVLWTVVNERDALGSDLVPDYLTSVRRDGFYGWPYSYFGDHVDTRVRPPRPDLVARALVPDYALGTHVAALGLAFTGADHPAPRDLPARFGDGAFVGLHGSWNRRPPAGYAVVFVPFAGDGPSGLPVEVLGGFLDAEGNARGRPVGVAIDGRGGLLVADDVGNTVWRVSGGTAP